MLAQKLTQNHARQNQVNLAQKLLMRNSFIIEIFFVDAQPFIDIIIPHKFVSKSGWPIRSGDTTENTSDIKSSEITVCKLWNRFLI